MDNEFAGSSYKKGRSYKVDILEIWNLVSECARGGGWGSEGRIFTWG